jgi:CBS domain-containing protein
MRVQDILRQKGSEVTTIAPTATLSEASQLLSIRRIGALVVSEDDRHIVGILSERDIVRHLSQDGAAALELEVAQAMTADVATCAKDDSLDHLARTMTEGRFRHLPVVEDGVLTGIVSIGDVVKRRVEELEHEAQALTEYIQTGR